ncbi:MAG: O-antigen ligase family protein, partial [Chloroflexota bacterium]
MIRQHRRMAAGFAIQALTLLVLYALEPVDVFSLVIVAAVLIVCSAWQPVTGIAVTAALLPLYHRPIRFDFGTLPTAEIALLTTIAGAMLHVTSATVRGRSLAALDDVYRRTVNSRLVWILFFLTLMGTISLLVNWSGAATGEGLREIRWTLVEPLLFVGLLVSFCRTRLQRGSIVAAYLIGALAFGAVALGDIFTGAGVRAGEVTRISGVYSHPNAMAMYSTRALVFGVALIFLTRQFRWHWMTTAAVSTVIVALTFARNALLAIAAVGIAMTWTVGRRIRGIAVAFAVAVGLALVAVAPQRMLDGLAGGSLDLRVDIWRSAILMIRDHPVFGIGPDQFFALYAPRYVEPTGWGERFTAHAHNLILDSWLRLGIIGAVFVILVMFLCASRVLRISKEWQVQPPLRSAAILALAVILLQGMIDNAYFVHDLAMSAWLLAWLGFESEVTSAEEGCSEYESACYRRRRTG